MTDLTENSWQLGEAPDHLELMQIIGVDIGGTLSWLASQQEAT